MQFVIFMLEKDTFLPGFYNLRVQNDKRLYVAGLEERKLTPRLLPEPKAYPTNKIERIISLRTPNCFSLHPPRSLRRCPLSCSSLALSLCIEPISAPLAISSNGGGERGVHISRRSPRQERDAAEETQHRPLPRPLQRQVLRRRHILRWFHQARSETSSTQTLLFLPLFSPPLSRFCSGFYRLLAYFVA